MKLNIFARDKTYFQSLRDNKVNIDSYNIDTQYNSIASYLNDEVVPAINDIIDGALPGILGSPDKYLRNKGDGTTQWDTIEKGISNHSIAFSKLVQSAVNSVLVTNGEAEVVAVSTNVADSVLIAQLDDAPRWSKLTSVNIADRQITGSTIADGSIGMEHIQPGIEVINIANGAIVGADFTANSITTAKFLNESITIPKLGVINQYIPPLDLYQNPQGVILKRHIINGTLTADKLADMSVSTIHFNKVKCITRGKVAADTVSDHYLGANKDQTNDLSYKLTSDKLAVNFKLNGTHLFSVGNNPYLDNVPLNKDDFNTEVRDAFIRKGC